MSVVGGIIVFFWLEQYFIDKERKQKLRDKNGVEGDKSIIQTPEDKPRPDEITPTQRAERIMEEKRIEDAKYAQPDVNNESDDESDDESDEDD